MIDCVTIYTDGAAEPNPGPGGYGVVLIAGVHRKELYGGFRHTTNNRMELLAVIAGLEALKRSTTATIISDSKYVVDSIQNRHVLKWKNNGWKLGAKKRAKNVDLWERYLAIATKHKVTLQWVKGHAGTTENERCDELAVAAIRGTELLIDHGYLEELRLQEAKREAMPTLFPDSKSGNVNTKPPTGEITAEQCRKCGTLLVKKPSRNKNRKPGQTYYFEWTMYCPGCKTLYLDEAAKRML